MKLIHTADIHASRERYPEVKKVLEKILNECTLNEISAVLISGDFWDSTITNTSASHFTDYLKLMQRICNYTTVIMIYGTPSHEPAGSLDVFSYIGAYVFNSYEPICRQVSVVGGTLEVLALPEPRLSMIEGTTLEDKYKKNAEIYRDFTDLIEQIPKTNPRICMFHNDVIGMKLQNGQKISDSRLGLTKEYLKSLNCDYYAGGHIHLPQELGNGLNGGYSGSAAPINFGETHDAGFVVIEI